MSFIEYLRKNFWQDNKQAISASDILSKKEELMGGLSDEEQQNVEASIMLRIHELLDQDVIEWTTDRRLIPNGFFNQRDKNIEQE